MLSFASAPGNLFNRIGKLGLTISQAAIYQAAQLINFTDTTNGVVAQYNSESDIQALMGSSYQGLLNSVSNVGGLAQNMANATLNRMVFRDNPRISQTLQSVNILDSMLELIRQMQVAGASVLAMTITATPSSMTGLGNGVINVSTRRPLDGRVLENTFAETVQLLCTSDSYTGGATEGNEQFTVTGVGSDGNVFAFNWPLGSNATQNVNAIDGSADNSSGNLLVNSGFETFTVANTPDNWEILVGTAGTNIFEEATLTYDPPPNTALRLLGDGSTLIAFQQAFDDSDGTTATLEALTQYSVNVFIRRDGVIPAAGVMQVSLVDENDTVIVDEGGIANSFNIALTGLTVFYASYTGVFRTPLILPSAMFLKLAFTTALTTGRSVYLDKISFGEMTQLYTGGPYFAMIAGSVPFSSGDYGTCVVTNSRGAAGTLNTWQTLFFRCFPIMGANELMLPSSSTPTIADSLIG